ncbi:hypothetical protein DXG01_009340 [Tephrocybe rancida]|nr:hypothetical protein DXG01_009340 [Tephrocybe rancida]
MEERPLEKQLDEFQLISSSLLSDETFTFLDEEEEWANLTAIHADPTDNFVNREKPKSPARFRIDIKDSRVSFVVEVPVAYEGKITSSHPIFTVKGDQISRSEHDRWQGKIEEYLAEIEDTEFPVYQLLLQLLPLVHEEIDAQLSSGPSPAQSECPRQPQSIYHALLTSHHLLSPSKRRSLQGWSASLSLSGFAKVGYPGVIYASGLQDDVEEFVTNVKAMQWLALKVRFIEQLPGSQMRDDRCWSEFQKVGEVVEEMRRLGREQYIVEMSIGSALR